MARVHDLEKWAKQEGLIGPDEHATLIITTSEPGAAADDILPAEWDLVLKSRLPQNIIIHLKHLRETGNQGVRLKNEFGEPIGYGPINARLKELRLPFRLARAGVRSYHAGGPVRLVRAVSEKT